MGLIDKLLDELGPYLKLEQNSLFYFVACAVIVILLHMIFAKFRFVKYVPGIVLIIYALIRLFLNKNGGFLRSSPEDLRASILTGACGLVSLIFARILAIMYKRNRVKRKRPLTEERKKHRTRKQQIDNTHENFSEISQSSTNDFKIDEVNHEINLINTENKVER